VTRAGEALRRKLRTSPNDNTLRETLYVPTGPVLVHHARSAAALPPLKARLLPVETLGEAVRP
jgi:hypothetical protein